VKTPVTRRGSLCAAALLLQRIPAAALLSIHTGCYLNTEGSESLVMDVKWSSVSSRSARGPPLTPSPPPPPHPRHQIEAIWPLPSLWHHRGRTCTAGGETRLSPGKVADDFTVNPDGHPTRTSNDRVPQRSPDDQMATREFPPRLLLPVRVYVQSHRKHILQALDRDPQMHRVEKFPISF